MTSSALYGNGGLGVWGRLGPAGATGGVRLMTSGALAPPCIHWPLKVLPSGERVPSKAAAVDPSANRTLPPMTTTLAGKPRAFWAGLSRVAVPSALMWKTKGSWPPPAASPPYQSPATGATWAAATAGANRAAAMAARGRKRIKEDSPDWPGSLGAACAGCEGYRFSSAGSPPWAVMLTLIARSTAKRSRAWGPPALGPVPDRPSPPNGWTPTTAPVIERFT